MLKFYWWRFRQHLKLKPQQVSSPKQVNAVVEQQSTKIINLVGYIILGLMLLDYITLFLNAKLFNPIWAWETSGKLVETVWGSLIGLILIFYRRDRDFIKPKELNFLALLSWLALFLGTVYFLITPILIGNAFRIERSQKAKFAIQISQQKERMQQYSRQLKSANEEQLNTLLRAYQQKTPELAITSPQQLKQNLLTQVRQQQQNSQKQLQKNFSKQRTELIETTFKWIIGAIISGIGFIMIWSHTQWTRVLRLTNTN
ncbi:HpsJ family protein [Myxosarcina sp. GI1]|uniref:HpsJ-like protein, cyanoexosortase A-associated n=1 Tax=Myxosarcina sp. GI1 TaxID=1541065 RepID=UPI00056CBE10|nr:HpsJ family protein [Myxosarcina sp. GI1]